MAYTHTVSAEGSSPITFSATGLPPGLSISSEGVISGTPTTSGNFGGIITASNGVLPSASQVFTILIRTSPVAPVITSARPPRDASVGTPYAFTATASGTGPITFSAAGLPPGLTMSPDGTVAGTPTEEGWYNGLFIATNPVDTRLQTVTIIVGPPDTGDPPTVAIAGDLVLIGPARVELTAEVSDDLLAPEELTIVWTQVGGPAVAIANADQLVPSVDIAEEGVYTFRITAHDGGSIATADLQLTAYPAVENQPEGSVVPNIQFVADSFDGLILAWDSEPGQTYIVAVKDDLNDPTWLVISDPVPSMGDTTYWTDDRESTTPVGFYGIFGIE